MKKLKISELKVTSFVTGTEKKVTGGVTPASFTCVPYTCAAYCSDTDGVHACKDTDNLTAYNCTAYNC